MGKIGFMVLMAAKNLLFISIEVLHSLIPSDELAAIQQNPRLEIEKSYNN